MTIYSLFFLVTTYESVRHTLEQNNITNTKVKSFVGGCCASVVGQTIIVPFDVITQHIMLIGLAEKGINKTYTKTHSSSLPELMSSSNTEKNGSANNRNTNHINMNKAGMYTQFQIRGHVLLLQQIHSTRYIIGTNNWLFSCCE